MLNMRTTEFPCVTWGILGHGKNMQACSPKSALWRMRSSSLNPEYKSFRHLPELLNWVAGTALFLFSESIIKRMSPSAAQIQGHLNFFCKRTLGLVTPIIFMAMQLSFLRIGCMPLSLYTSRFSHNNARSRSRSATGAMQQTKFLTTLKPCNFLPDFYATARKQTA